MLSSFSFLRFCVALFTGAAIYINLVEHPARMGGDTKTAATVWAPSYKKATVMQAPLAILSFFAGAGTWLLGGGILWLIGAVLIGLVVPYTFIVVMPCHPPKLDRCSKSEGRLHAVRSVLSLLASIVYLLSLVTAS
jgi:hypothetical protein